MNIRSVFALVKRRLLSARTITLLVIWIFMLDTYLSGYRSEAVNLGRKDAAAILPHLQNDFYFNKIILLAVVCFFSNVPFMEQEELYAVTRLGKSRWGIRNICCILLCSLALSMCLTAFSIVLILPAVDFSNEWGSLFQTFAVSGLVGNVQFNQQAMYAYSPYTLQLHIF